MTTAWTPQERSRAIQWRNHGRTAEFIAQRLGKPVENVEAVLECRKGRHGRGNLKLSDQAVREVLANPQASVGELATRYSVSRSLIYIIRQGKHRNPDKPLFEFRGHKAAA